MTDIINVTDLLDSNDLGQSLFFKNELNIVSTEDNFYHHKLYFYNGQVCKLTYERKLKNLNFIIESLQKSGWEIYNGSNYDAVKIFKKEDVTCSLLMKNEYVLICFNRKIKD